MANMFNFLKSKRDIEQPWDDNWKLDIIHLRYHTITQAVIWICPPDYKVQLTAINLKATPDGGISASVLAVEGWDAHGRLYKLNGNILTSTSVVNVSYMVWDTLVARSTTSINMSGNMPDHMYLRPGSYMRFFIPNPLPNHTFNHITLTMKRWNMKG